MNGSLSSCLFVVIHLKEAAGAGSVSGIDKGTKAPRNFVRCYGKNGCQRGRMDMSKIQ